MNIRKKLVAAGAALGILVAGAAVAAPANAEPVSGGYAVVGSDTLQDVVNALANGSSNNPNNALVRVKAGADAVGNYDAFGSLTIQTKQNGPYFPRPNGSGAGVNALIASVRNTTFLTSASTIGGQVDIARSSSAAGTNANAAGDLLYVPFGRDALGYIYKGAGNWDQATKDAFGNLSAAQLREIYTGNLTTLNGVTVKPRLPQSASGTRSTFLSKIGVTGTPTVSVPADNTTAGPAENDATVLATAGEIIPFSAAAWIAQANGAAAVNTTTAADVAFGHADGLEPFVTSNGKLSPNTAYYNSPSIWGRDTYLVVEYARVTATYPSGPNAGQPNPRYDAKLAALVNPVGTGQTSFVTNAAGNSTVGAIKRSYGFLAPSSTTVVRSHPDVYADSVWPGV
jgi:hypothetical protein